MSSKSSLALGPNFHFYREVFDDDHVYLEIDSTHFEVRYNHVVLPIPVHIWEVIRRIQGIKFEYIDKTDAEMLQYVEHEVDERICRCQVAREEGKLPDSLSGLIAYGPSNDDRAEQITSGMSHFTNIRNHEQQVRLAIEELEKLNADHLGNKS
ncbi:MAG: hypothetical protein ACXWJZ_04880 [Burkholderiaceae bacterium]